MRNAIITFAIIVTIIGWSFYTVKIDEENSPEELTRTFINFIFEATPEMDNRINSDGNFGVNEYVLENLSDKSTDKIIESLYANRIIDMSSMIAREYNSNVTIEDFEIVKIQNSNNKIHHDFEAVFKVISIETGDEFTYPLKGQIGIIMGEDEMKIFALKLFTIGILDHKYKR